MSYKSVLTAMAVAASVFCSLPVALACEQTQPPPPKVIHDATEYNAYVTAASTTDPAARAGALEKFVDDYPASVVCIDAMEQAMAAYQQARDGVRLQKSAERLLQADPDNIRALAVLVTIERRATDNKQWPQLKLHSDHGLRVLENWETPPELSEADAKHLKSRMSAVFHGGRGFVALQEKDFATARQHYLSAVQSQPDDLPNTFQLAIADLEMTNPDVAGFWYVAHAMSLAEANRQVVSSMAAYGKAKYVSYHGSEQGWAELVRRARTESAPPRNFTVARAAVPVPARPVQPPVNAASQPGIPASITSQGVDGTLHGVPASITSQDSKGLHGVPASIASASPSGKNAGARGVLAGVTSPTAAPGAPAPQDDQAATVFVFKDGHRILAKNYVIYGKTLFNYSTNPMSKVSIDEIDLDATRKVNDDRGVVVKLQ